MYVLYITTSLAAIRRGCKCYLCTYAASGIRNSVQDVCMYVILLSCFFFAHFNKMKTHMHSRNRGEENV
jgi:hypothetical protein